MSGGGAANANSESERVGTVAERTRASSSPGGASLSLVENRSPRTVTTDRFHAQSFVRFLGVAHPMVSVLTARVEHIRAFLVHEADRGISPVTRSTATIAIKNFYAYLSVANGLADPTAGLRVRLVRGQRNDVYSDAQADTILAWAASQPGVRWQVGHVLVATLRYTGLRLDELVSLRLDQADVGEGRFSVIGKGRKHRLVPIPPPLASILVGYLHDVRPDLAVSPFVFVNPKSYGDRQYHGRYGPTSVEHLVKEAGARAGVNGPHCPHRWRHTYATSLLRRGVDIHKVQRLLGHSNIATTERYLHLDDTDLAAAINLAFPEETTPNLGVVGRRITADVPRLSRGQADYRLR